MRDDVVLGILYRKLVGRIFLGCFPGVDFLGRDLTLVVILFGCFVGYILCPIIQVLGNVARD